MAPPSGHPAVIPLAMELLRHRLFRRIPLEMVLSETDTRAQPHGLVRGLGPLQLTTLGIGNAIGAGIFVLTGEAAAQYAGPAIALSYVFAGIACLLTSLCYAEISTLIPSAGGSFAYARVTLGRLPAWLIGWSMIMEYLVAGATVAVGWSGYVQNLLWQLGLALPRALAAPPLAIAEGSLVRSDRLVNLPAVLMVAICTCVLVRGLRHSAVANASMVAIKVAVILAVLAVGSFYVNSRNWVPFVPPAAPGNRFGWHGVFTASAVAFFSYSGFEAMSTAARECRNPARDLPVALMASVGICIFLYLATALVLTGMAPYSRLDTASPVSTALSVASPRLTWLITIVNIGTVLGLGAAVLVSLFGQTRTFYSMAVVGFLPSSFARVHTRYRTPSVAIIYTGSAAAAIAGLFPIELLGELVSMGILIAFSSVCAGVLILRRARPDAVRPFRVPFYPWVPILGLTSCMGLMFSLPRLTWLNLAIWLALGLVLFFLLPEERSPAAARPVSGGEERM